MANQKEVEEGNKLIAEFMGGTINTKKRRKGYWYDGIGDFSHPMHESALCYNESWDWLMPVVEKIGNTTVKSEAPYNSDLSFRIEIVNGYTKIEGTGYRIFRNSCVEGSMLKATYASVIQFINWYNQLN